MNLKAIDRSRKPLREHNAEFVAAEVVENLQAQLAQANETIVDLQEYVEGLKIDLAESEKRGNW